MVNRAPQKPWDKNGIASVLILVFICPVHSVSADVTSSTAQIDFTISTMNVTINTSISSDDHTATTLNAFEEIMNSTAKTHELYIKQSHTAKQSSDVIQNSTPKLLAKEDIACARIIVKNTKKAMDNPDSINAIKCVLLSSTIMAGVDAQAKFLNCLEAYDIDFHDQAVMDVLWFGTMDECFPGIETDENNMVDSSDFADLGRATYLLCLTYYNLDDLIYKKLYRYMCVLPENKTFSRDSNQETLAELYRQYCPAYKLPLGNLRAPEIHPELRRELKMVSYGPECAFDDIPKVETQGTSNSDYMILPIISGIGLFGNVLVLSVTGKPSFVQMSPINICFSFFVVSDIFIIGIFYYYYTMIEGFTADIFTPVSKNPLWLCTLVLSSIDSITMFASYIMVYITFVRQKVIANPLHASHDITRSKVYKTVCLILLFCIVFSSILNIIPTHLPNEVPTCNLHIGLLKNYDGWFYTVYAMLRWMMIYILPWFLMSIFGLLAAFYLRKAHMRRNNLMLSTPERSQHIQVTVLLLMSCVSFLVFNMPDGALPIVTLFKIKDLTVQKALFKVTSIMVVLRSSSNFLLYFISGSNFRSEIYQNGLFVCRIPKRCLMSRMTQQTSAYS